MIDFGSWVTLARYLRGKGKQKTADEAVRTLTGCWERILKGESSKEDAEIVMADLGEYTRFYQGLVDATPNQIIEHNGMRLVFERILRFSNLSYEQRKALFEGVQVEEATEAQEEFFE